MTFSKSTEEHRHSPKTVAQKQSPNHRLSNQQSMRQPSHADQLRDQIGICQWFHYEAYSDLQRTIILLQELGIRHLRTGISWADYLRPNGRAWYDWQMAQLHAAGFHILLSVWHTPPSLAEGGQSGHPPHRLRDYADFIDLIITRYGDQFAELELWNEPNNRYKWNFIDYDPDWRKFANMIVDAAYWAKKMGKTTVLGGMAPVDHHWLELLRSYNALSDIDIISIHAFPEMWWDDAPNWEWYSHWRGWSRQIAYIAQHAEGRPIWVTETGLATWDMAAEVPGRYQLQVERLERAVNAPVERLFWYSAIDLAPHRAAIEGFHVDENEYHMGLVNWAGQKKPAYRRLRELLQTHQTLPLPHR